MTEVTPVSVIAIDDEKRISAHNDSAEADMTDVAVSKEDASYSDGDEALKLAGIHAHQFDEKYYLRLRRKIVS